MIQHHTPVGGVNVSHETMDQLNHYVSLIKKWTKSINLIAPNSVPELWDRHIVDSAQIFNMSPTLWTNWVDLGSGGGLPGLVIAILDPKQRPLTLIESDQRKCLFLSTVRRELDLNVNVIHTRIESASVNKVNILTARALAPLSELLAHADRFLEPEGTAIFPKGARYQEELDHAAEDWHFDVTAHQSLTNPDARILEISRIHRRER